MSHYCDYEYELKSSTNLHSTSSLPSKNRWRVKLFQMKGDIWNDIGIGFIHIKQIAKEFFLNLITEDIEPEIFLEIKIHNRLEFNNQRGTIMTWRNENSEEDNLAISFQEKEGLRDTLKLIFQIQGKEFTDEAIASDEDDFLQYEISENTLKDILDELSIAIKNNDIKKFKYIVDTIITDRGKAIKEIGTIFNENERTCNIEVLSLIYLIFKNIIIIADQNLLEMLMSDEFYLLTFGALEYDVELLKTHNFIKHRNFLEEANFINYFDIQDQDFVYKVHINYRLSYLRDVAIGRFIEEYTLKNINIIIQNNNVEIIQFFTYNKQYIQQLFFRIESQLLEKKSEGIAFLLELTEITKEINNQVKKNFYDTLSEFRYLDLIENTISLISIENLEDLYEYSVIDKINKMKAKLIQILINCLICTPGIVKNYIICKSQKTREHSLLQELCELLLKNDNFGIKFEVKYKIYYKISEFLKGLLDNDVSDKKNEFFELFFSRILKKFIDFLRINENESISKNELINSKQLIVEILCHCLKHHGHRMRYYTIQNHVLKVVADLIHHNSKIINMMIIKFIKSIILNRDEFLNDILFKENIFDTVFKILLSNLPKNNLISSSILDLFNLISTSKLDRILSYIFEGYSNIIFDDRYLNYFKELIKNNENIKKPSIFNANLCTSDITYKDKEDNNISELNENVQFYISKNSQFLNKKHYLIFEDESSLNQSITKR